MTLGKTVKPCLVLATALMMSACATKQYGRVQGLSDVEKKHYSCREIAIELEKVRQFELQIEETGKFDGRTALGFLGDFGIGNSMAKSDATRSAKIRRYDLESLQANNNCTAGILPASEVNKSDS